MSIYSLLAAYLLIGVAWTVQSILWPTAKETETWTKAYAKWDEDGLPREMLVPVFSVLMVVGWLPAVVLSVKDWVQRQVQG
jgi:hypothetical protein